MAKSFLTAVNDLLKEAKIIQGDAGELTSFTSTERQTDVDSARSSWNDLLLEIYSRDDSFPRASREGKFALVEGQREYALAADFEIMAADELRNETDGLRLTPYDGGYNKMWADQTSPDNWVGTPNHWALSPKANKIRIDRNPGSSDATNVYKYLYIKDLSMSLITDLFPFSDQVVMALTPAAAELYKFKRHGQEGFSGGIYTVSLGRGLRYLRGVKNTRRYGVHG